MSWTLTWLKVYVIVSKMSCEVWPNTRLSSKTRKFFLSDVYLSDIYPIFNLGMLVWQNWNRKCWIRKSWNRILRKIPQVQIFKIAKLLGHFLNKIRNFQKLDLKLLQHDKILQHKQVSSHLKFIPEYLLPSSLTAVTSNPTRCKHFFFANFAFLIVAISSQPCQKRHAKILLWIPWKLLNIKIKSEKRKQNKRTIHSISAKEEVSGRDSFDTCYKFRFLFFADEEDKWLRPPNAHKQSEINPKKKRKFHHKKKWSGIDSRNNFFFFQFK